MKGSLFCVQIKCVFLSFLPPILIHNRFQQCFHGRMFKWSILRNEGCIKSCCFFFLLFFGVNPSRLGLLSLMAWSPLLPLPPQWRCLMSITMGERERVLRQANIQIHSQIMINLMKIYCIVHTHTKKKGHC